MKATWNNLDKKMQFYKLCSTTATMQKNVHFTNFLLCYTIVAQLCM